MTRRERKKCLSAAARAEAADTCLLLLCEARAMAEAADMPKVLERVRAAITSAKGGAARKRVLANIGED